MLGAQKFLHSQVSAYEIKNVKYAELFKGRDVLPFVPLKRLGTEVVNSLGNLYAVCRTTPYLSPLKFPQTGPEEDKSLYDHCIICAVRGFPTCLIQDWKWLLDMVISELSV